MSQETAELPRQAVSKFQLDWKTEVPVSPTIPGDSVHDAISQFKPQSVLINSRLRVKRVSSHSGYCLQLLYVSFAVPRRLEMKDFDVSPVLKRFRGLKFRSE